MAENALIGLLAISAWITALVLIAPGIVSRLLARLMQNRQAANTREGERAIAELRQRAREALALAAERYIAEVNRILHERR